MYGETFYGRHIAQCCNAVMLRTLLQIEDIYMKNITITVRLPFTCYEMDSSNIALFTCKSGLYRLQYIYKMHLGESPLSLDTIQQQDLKRSRESWQPTDCLTAASLSTALYKLKKNNKKGHLTSYLVQRRS